MSQKISEEGERIKIRLADRRWSLLSHVENIKKGIQEIDNYENTYPGKDPVIGYLSVYGLGRRGRDHEVLPHKLALQIQKYYEQLNIKHRIKYKIVCLEELLGRQDEISKEMYDIEDGLVLGLSENYS